MYEISPVAVDTTRQGLYREVDSSGQRWYRELRQLVNRYVFSARNVGNMCIDAGLFFSQRLFHFKAMIVLVKKIGMA